MFISRVQLFYVSYDPIELVAFPFGFTFLTFLSGFVRNDGELLHFRDYRVAEEKHLLCINSECLAFSTDELQYEVLDQMTG